MFKSLRWRLQVWHAIVLLIVLTSFGGIVHSLHWQTRLQQVDAELDRTAGVVMSQLRRLLPRPPGGRPGGGRRPRRADEANPETDTVARPDTYIVAAAPRPDSPRTETSPENRPAPPPDQAGPPGLTRRDRFDPGPLPEEFQQLFHGDEESRLYFVIWGGNGDLLQKSDSAPEISYPNLHVGREG